MHSNNNHKKILHSTSGTHTHTLLPEITAKIGNDVGVFTVLHHYNLLLHDCKVLTFNKNTHNIIIVII